MKRVLALDPGDRVGWARANVSDDGVWGDLKHGITELKPMVLTADKRIRRGDYDAVVMETWRLYPHMANKLVGSEIPSAQFIGAIKVACWTKGVPLVMQPASRINSKSERESWADATLRKLWPDMYTYVNRYGTHDDLHDMAAIRHLWAFTYDNTEVLNGAKAEARS